VPFDGPHKPDPNIVGIGVGLAVALSMIAGMTDAIGFIRSRDFVSFMTGNTTHLAIALGNGLWREALPLFLLILGFVLGNTLGCLAVILTRGRQTPLLLLVALLLGVAALISPMHTLSLPALLLLVLAMGASNAGLQRIGGTAVSVSFVSGGLSRFGIGLAGWIMGERRPGWVIQAVPWIGMLRGAIVGAELEMRLQTVALWVPCAAMGGLAFLSLGLPHERQQGFTTVFSAASGAGKRRSSTG
jgi:uncharacterized membrane protein YoaK (UPF0700 family)